MSLYCTEELLINQTEMVAPLQTSETTQNSSLRAVRKKRNVRMYSFTFGPEA